MTTDHPEIATAEPEAPPVDAPPAEAPDLDSPVRALDGPEYIEVDGVQVPNYDLTIPIFSEGDVVTGRVVRVDKDEVLVDIGYKSEGVIPLPELSIRKSVRPDEEVSLGEMVDALVMQKEDQEGRLILSKKRARFEKAWKRIEAAAAAGENVEGTVIEVVKGGLILDLGVRGFLPASLVNIRRVQDLDEFLGRKLECKVIELNRNRNNVVLSRRAVLEDERREVRQKILDDLQPGKVVEGVISNIVEFGAFVDLDGIDGLIHISELSWSHVNHPSEVLQIGEKVRVKVLDIDRDRQRISLGLKQTQADPWQSVIEAYEVGDVVEGRVTKVVTFGAFVEIHPGVEGLVHISELAAHHVENPREVVNQGDVLAVRIIEIDADRRRLSLSLKRVADSDPIQHRLPDDVRAAAAAQAAEVAELSDEAEAAEAVDDAIAEAVVEEAVEEVVAEAAIEEAVEEAIVEEPPIEEARGRKPRSRRPSSRRPWRRRSSRRRSKRPRRKRRSRRPSKRPSSRRRSRRPRRRPPSRRRSRRPRSRRRSRPRSMRPSPRTPPPRLTRPPRTPRSPPPRRSPPRATTPRARRIAGAPGAPPCLALTGGIGSGKSEALGAFAACGAATLSSDQVVHDLYGDPDVLRAVVERFGPGVLAAGGEVDRAALGARAFAQEGGIAYLEGLLHPRIEGRRRAWAAEQAARRPPPPLLVCEVPLLFEAGAEGGFDAALLVTAPDDVRRRRVEARGQDFDERSARQLPEDEKAARADRVLVNDAGLDDLRAWVAARFAEYAGRPCDAPIRDN